MRGHQKSTRKSKCSAVSCFGMLRCTGLLISGNSTGIWYNCKWRLLLNYLSWTIPSATASHCYLCTSMHATILTTAIVDVRWSALKTETPKAISNTLQPSEGGFVVLACQGAYHSPCYTLHGITPSCIQS